MNRVPVLFAIACLLAGCDRPQALSVETLAADPARLHALAAQCRRGERDGAFCARVAQADLRRFLSGQARPDEYRTLAELPPIPASFDGPAPATSDGETP
ncbi:EexN family lipoprotein [Burkholderia multivorans]|uniref:EexN family lipoprotein n=1 Tax=Burkholderia multivorans TaxID=87883 RepID=UPI001C23741D|nr:EexN family lipoprotein [Burkholderia multivorans]MBU9610645.1 EexN family lipoprotein [Burkholderia multivorans]